MLRSEPFQSGHEPVKVVGLAVNIEVQTVIARLVLYQRRDEPVDRYRNACFHRFDVLGAGEDYLLQIRANRVDLVQHAEVGSDIGIHAPPVLMHLGEHACGKRVLAVAGRERKHKVVSVASGNVGVGLGLVHDPALCDRQAQ